MARIAVAGFQHETNTFAPLKADLAAFEVRSDWPPLCRGERLLSEIDGVHLPITGAVGAFIAAGHTVVPLLWCSATPSDRVTRGAYETVVGQMLDMLADQWPVDALYLDLHGAMVCDHLDDGEGELLRRLRKAYSPDFPIAVSLDLHANISQQMVDKASLIDCFREYPHTDMGECGARTARGLMQLLEQGQGAVAHTVMHKLDYQIPLTQGCTLVDPARAVYRRLEQLADTAGLASVVFACGFPLADVADSGPAIVVTGSDAAQVQSVADALLAELTAWESDFGLQIHSPEAAIALVQQQLLLPGSGPVVLADTQDNPGGGGAGDTVGIFKALLAAAVQSAVVGMVADPALANAAHSAGVGATISGELGEWSGFTGEAPYSGSFRVLALGDGNCTATGPMWRGAHLAMGSCALLQVDGVRVAVSSTNMQLADQAMLRHFGVEPQDEQIIALKSSVHFRNDFQDIARQVLMVASPGPVTADLSTLEYKHLRSSLRRVPNTKG